MTKPNQHELVKLYYRIGEVSRIVGVQPHVLRYWESEFRTIRPQKSNKGQRVYSRRDVEKLLRVKDLLKNQGFTIAGARKQLASASGGEAPAHASARRDSQPRDSGPTSQSLHDQNLQEPGLRDLVLREPVLRELGSSLEAGRSSAVARDVRSSADGTADAHAGQGADGGALDAGLGSPPSSPQLVLTTPRPRPQLVQHATGRDAAAKASAPPSAKRMRRALVALRAELCEMLAELRDAGGRPDS